MADADRANDRLSERLERIEDALARSQTGTAPVRHRGRRQGRGTLGLRA